MKVTCIDDRNRPKEIPKKKWISKGFEYELLWINFSFFQQTMCFVLAEIDLDESCHPYACFLASRFSIREEDLEEFLELAKSCTEANNWDLLEEITRKQLEMEKI